MSTISPDWNLDVGGSARLEKELMHAQPTEGEVVVDLSGVNFVASSGLRVLLKTAQRLGRDQAKLVVANPNKTVREVLAMSGFDKIITIR